MTETQPTEMAEPQPEPRKQAGTALVAPSLVLTSAETNVEMARLSELTQLITVMTETSQMAMVATLLARSKQSGHAQAEILPQPVPASIYAEMDSKSVGAAPTETTETTSTEMDAAPHVQSKMAGPELVETSTTEMYAVTGAMMESCSVFDLLITETMEMASMVMVAAPHVSLSLDGLAQEVILILQTPDQIGEVMAELWELNQRIIVTMET